MTYYREGQMVQPKTGRAARTRIGAYNSPARRRAILTTYVTRFHAATNAVTAANYLAGIGADTDTIRRFAAQLGIRIAKAYRAERETEPAQTGLAVAGRPVRPFLVPTFAYTAADLPLIEKAARDYKNTAHLVAPAAEPATIAPADLAFTLAARLGMPLGFVTARVTEATDAMHTTPANYNPAIDRLTEAGAALIEQTIRLASGAEVQRYTDEHPAARHARTLIGA